LTEADLGFQKTEFERLRYYLEQAYAASTLPEAARGSAALHEFLLRLRLGAAGIDREDSRTSDHEVQQSQFE
jgi:hypothetical protein